MNDKKTSYKLLSIDLDGTLLSPILRKAKKGDCCAIQEFMSAGGSALINTGRAPWAIVKTIKRINKFGPNRIKFISCFNGAYIRDFQDNKIYETQVSHSLASQLLKIVKSFNNATIWFYTLEGRKNKYIESWPFNPLMKAVSKRGKLVGIKNPHNLASNKINIFSTSKMTVAKIYHELINNGLHRTLTLSHTSPRLIEITPFNVNKGYAIGLLSKKYKIGKNEIASVGDSFNDLSAFNASSLSIGINPSNPKLLTHCDAIVDHKSNGVAHAIRNYLLKDKVFTSKYKLIFSDLDGTLIDGKTKLYTKETKIALQQCTNHLIPICIASGRSIFDGINIVKAMELNPKTNIYIIGNNGATIYDIFTDRYISQSPIENSRAKEVFNDLVSEAKKVNGNLGFIIHQHSKQLIFYNHDFWKPINFKKTGNEEQYDLWVGSRPIYVTKFPEDIITYKFSVKYPNEQAALKGQKYLAKKFKDLEVVLSSPVNVEINKKGINKGFALDRISKEIKIKPNQIIVLGDGQNDIEALKKTNNSFTPIYAPAFVRKVAKHIVKDVDVTNFASTVIYKHVLKKEESGK